MGVHDSTQDYAEDKTADWPLLDVNGVATALGVSRNVVYQLVREGELHPIRVRTRFRFRPSDLAYYLRAQREEVSAFESAEPAVTSRP